ncbi:MAG: hypothetical protein CMM58_01580 [Rhodospirillaceae bacterium]|nr:hypothetical protein [Rhodospirillaceae bacterium]|tara:strand:- start:52 stop:1119 length:1068 start_codon:yes stop_codon:yes gene_type:complete
MKTVKNRVGSKKRLFLIIAIPIIFFLYCCAWFAVSQWSYYKIQDFLSSSENKYIKYNPDSFIRSGFPFRVEWQIEAVTASVPYLDGQIECISKDIIMGMSILESHRIDATAKNASFLFYDKSDSVKWKSDLGNASFVIIADTTGATSATYEVKNAVISYRTTDYTDDKWKTLANIQTIKGQFNQIKPIDPNSTKILRQIDFVSSNIVLNTEKARYPKSSSKILVSLSIIGDFGVARLEDLVEWRDEGGIIEIENAKLSWPPINIELSGTLALDQELKPIGAGSILVSGSDQIIDQQVSNGSLKKSEAEFLKLSLKLLPLKTNTNGVSSIQIPITAQNGKLRFGPFVVAKLSSLFR